MYFSKAAKHKKIEYKKLIFLIILSIIAVLISVICLNPKGWAKSIEWLVVANADDNYATKDYWDEKYGPHTDKYLTGLSAGQTLSTGDYFINQDISVEAPASETVTTPGIVISGTVNIYLEKKQGSDDFPTLSIKGSDSKFSAGAGAGIQLTEGNYLYIRGKGDLDIKGGSAWSDYYVKAAEPTKGAAGRHHKKDPAGIVIDIYGGAGGNGGNGFGGGAAAIGSNGASGGAGGSGATETHEEDWWYYDEQETGHHAGAGQNGGTSFNAGTLIINGDVNSNFVSGFAGKNWYYGTQIYAGASHTDHGANSDYSTGGGGGSGAWGGIGFGGPVLGIGSGGAGAGGGGGGGGGHITLHNDSKEPLKYECSGGGGSSGGGNNPISERQSMQGHANAGSWSAYTYKSEEGQWETPSETGIHRQFGARGGYGAHGGYNWTPGNGGKGGDSGLSGAAGWYFSTIVDSSKLSEGDSEYALGRSAAITRCFPVSDCEWHLEPSLVNWCNAYVINNQLEDKIKISYLPRNIKLSRNKDFIVEINKVAGAEQDFTVKTNYDVNNKATLTKDDMINPAANIINKVWLVNKGIVNINSEGVKEKDYDGKPIDLIENSSFTDKDGNDVKEEILNENIETKWYRVVDGQKVLLDAAPTTVGSYVVEWTVKGSNYIGTEWQLNNFEIKPAALNIKAKDATKQAGHPDPNFSVYGEGLADCDTLVAGTDYTISRDAGEEKLQRYKINVTVLFDSDTYKNYSPVTTSEGYLYVTAGLAYAKVKDVEVTYGDEFDESKLEIERAYYKDEQGQEIDLEMRKGIDYTCTCKPARDVGEYMISVNLIYGVDTLPSRFAFYIETGKYIVKQIETEIKVRPLTAIKEYDGKPNYDIPLTYGEGWIEGDTLKLWEDFTIDDIEDWTMAGRGDEFTIKLIPNGPVAKNYKNLVAYGKATYMIAKRKTNVYANEVVTTYGTEAPVTITVDRLVEGETFTEGNDYSISRSEGKDVGTYDVSLKMKRFGPYSWNYEFEEVKGSTYTIKPADATIKVDDISKIYMQDDPKFSVTGTGIQYGEEFELGTDFNASRDQGEVVGNYTIRPQVLESEKTKNYNLSVETGILTINKFTDFEHVVISQVPDQTYSGRQITPELTITYTFADSANNKTVTLIGGWDYTVEYTDNIDVGKATAIIVGIGSCEGETQTNFNIIKKNASITCDNVEAVYGQKDKPLPITTKDVVSWDELTEGKDYTISRTEGTTCGDYAITATVIPEGPIAKNYNFTSITPGKYTIIKFTDFENIQFDPIEPRTYDNKEYCPVVKAKYKFADDDEKEFITGTDYTVSYSNNIDAGQQAKATITGINNCEGEASTYFEILRATATATCNSYEAIYGEEQKEMTITTDGLIDGQELVINEDYTTQRQSGDFKGTYEITATIFSNGPVSKNYVFSSITPGTYTINQFEDFDNVMVADIAPIEFTGLPVYPDFNVTYKFEEQNLLLKASNINDDDNTGVFKEGKDFVVNCVNNINPGTATATLTGINSCTGQKIVNFEIVPSALYWDMISQTGDLTSVWILGCIVIVSGCVFIVNCFYRKTKGKK